MPTRVTKLVCVLALMVTSQICAAETSLQRFDGFGGPVFLEVDKAFKMSSLTSEQDVIVRWQIAPEYYLYKHQLLFTVKTDTDDARTIVVSLPNGKHKHDEYFGDVETYYGELEVNVPVSSGNFEINVQYQGCADAGLCYPPQKRTIAREM
ncbi:MAG: thiol:disulfide interchange protein [Gammaproteobacteria bacterium]|nr:thiol:disulfide interchange protein [Gammaproteobacteria bacterium]